ncbi:Uncharacterised protein [Vibrio cholerae]|nr:Uncharacterised protein [Vibrio cholerae]
MVHTTPGLTIFGIMAALPSVLSGEIRIHSSALH